jgi:hypothetical protein
MFVYYIRNRSGIIIVIGFGKTTQGLCTICLQLSQILLPFFRDHVTTLSKSHFSWGLNMRLASLISLL